MSEAEDFERRVRAVLDADRQRRRLQWRERLRTAGPWVAVVATLASPFVTVALTRSWP